MFPDVARGSGVIKDSGELEGVDADGETGIGELQGANLMTYNFNNNQAQEVQINLTS